MTTTLSHSAYDRVANVSEFVTKLGADIAKSQMFGIETDEQGRILALDCMARHMPPLQLAERFHFIKGKLSMKAEAALAEWRGRGGDHVILQRNHEGAAIRLIRPDGNACEFQLTWEQCQDEPFIYTGKEEANAKALLPGGDRSKLVVKPKYMTPRARMQMMWARLVMDSVRAVAPECVCGHYTPHEIADFTNDDSIAVESDTDLQTIEGEVKDTTSLAGQENQIAASESQVNTIAQLVQRIDMSGDDLAAALGRRGANSINTLETSAADEFILALRNVAKQLESKAEQSTGQEGSETTAADSEFAPSEDGRVTAELNDAIKNEIGIFAQQEGENLVIPLQNMFRNRGMEKITDLPFKEGLELLQHIRSKTMDKYFEKTLQQEGPAPAE